MRTRLALAAALALGLTATPHARAGEPGAPLDARKLADCCVRYDASKEATFHCEIREVIELPYDQAAGRDAVSVLVKADGPDGTFLAYLGPKAYLNRLGLRVAAGDQMTIVGAPTAIAGVSVVLVKETSWETGRLTLRGRDGRLL